MEGKCAVCCDGLSIAGSLSAYARQVDPLRKNDLSQFVVVNMLLPLLAGFLVHKRKIADLTLS
ncbi:MAG: hypothetical protein M2R46_05417 [Verrucomicrobia subdivision 3 bacterium]|nr:hypothetical protein [Limisphaerales bacterium]